MKLSMKDARLEAMRGNLDARSLKKEEAPEEPKPEPVVQKEVQVAAPVTIDTTPMAQAVLQSSQMQSDVLARAMEMLKTDPVQPVRKWTFKITERDRMGNIISFTAEAA